MKSPTPLRLMDLAAAIILLLSAVPLVFRPIPAVYLVVLIGCLAVEGLLWVAWRRGTRGKLVCALLVAVSTIPLIFSSGGYQFGTIWLVMFVVIAEFSPVGGAIYAVCLLIASIPTLDSDPATFFLDFAFEVLFVGLALSILCFFEFYRKQSIKAQQALVEQRENSVIKERLRIATELHDGLGHTLTAASLGLDYAHRVIDHDPDAARAEIVRTHDLISGAIHEMRSTVRAMEPLPTTDFGAHPPLSELGIKAMLTPLHRPGTHINVNTAPGISELKNDVADLYLSTIKEGVTNVLRHSDATVVDVDVAPGSITVSHNGSRARRSQAQRDRARDDLDHHNPTTAAYDGFGLRSLRRRAEALGGTLNAGFSDEGFTLRVDLEGVRA